MSNISCGIDFGTTNTVAALAKGERKTELVPLENTETTIPSVIFFSIDGKMYFGRKAMKMYMDGELGRCMRSLKRVLGSDLMSSGTCVQNKKISFIEVLSYFLQNVKNKIDIMTGTDVENVVLGRPVHFFDNDSNRDLRAENELKKIATNVGFKNIEFQYEPIAAAFAHEIFIEKEKLACAVDIGGGTSDFTILRIGKKLATKKDRKEDILASTGSRIGGNDFDKDLSLKCFMPIFGYGTQQRGQMDHNKIIDLPTGPFRNMAEWSSINAMYDYKELFFAKKMLYNAFEKEKVKRFVELIEEEQGYSLLNIVEDTKIQLTNITDVSVKLNFVSDKPTITATRSEFEDSLNWDIERIFNQIDECIKLAQIKSSDINLVILTGGSTEIPYIQRLVSNRFPNAELSQGNKLSSVAMGLAYDSHRRFHDGLDF